jgi:hypothetical protein
MAVQLWCITAVHALLSVEIEYIQPAAGSELLLNFALCGVLCCAVLSCRMIWIRSLKQSRVSRLGQLLGFARATSDGAFSATIW